jgi:hypothetical protein
LSLQPGRSLALLILFLALALSGCGGGGEDESASSATSSAQSATQEGTARAAQPSEEGKPKRASAQGKGEEEQSSKPRPRHITVKLPPISSTPVEGSKLPAPGVKTAKDGDNSVQGYGVESGDSVREEAALALQAYLDARLQEDWGRACSYLSQRPEEQLEEQTTQPQFQGQGASPAKQPSGCAGAMEALSKGVPRSVLRESAQVTEVLSFRIEGEVPTDPSFLLYQGLPEKTLYSMPMYMEGGGWKVGLVLPSALPV